MRKTRKKRRGKRELKVRVLQRGDYCHEPKWIEARVREAVALMFSTRMANTLRLRVEMRQTKLERRKDGKANGTATYSKVTDHSRKEFSICIHKYLNYEAFFRVLCHELGHIKQYVEGRLRYGERAGEQGWLWKADRAGQATHFPFGALEWKDRPWEQEACRYAEEYAPVLKKKWMKKTGAKIAKFRIFGL